jgi:hypothetical protein
MRIMRGAEAGSYFGCQPRANVAAIVKECQPSRELPDVANTARSGLLYASMHGLIDLEARGRMRPAKGLPSVGPSVNLLVQLLSPKRHDGEA